MFNVGGGELLVIMLIALIVLGPQRLPDAARQVGKVMSEVRRVSSGFQRELKDAFDASESETPARRTEASPLAATVADADADAKAGSTDGTGTTASPGSGDGGEDGTAAAPVPEAVQD
ncbi:MAG: Sec-independent protein translocase protein TatB, partial [Acidimicrobiales bacterium]